MADAKDNEQWAPNNSTVEMEDGTTYQVRDGTLIPFGNPVTGGGVAKAFGTGLLHNALPGIAGAPADIASGISNWWKDLKPQEGGAKVPEPAPEGGTIGSKTPQVNPSGVPETLTSGGISKAIGEVVPRHRAANETEKAAEAAGTFLPFAAAGPEGLTARGAALNLTKYGIAPTVAGGAVGAASDYMGNPDRGWARTGAELAAPFIAHKFITPNPVTPEVAASAKPYLEAGGRATPGQFKQNPGLRKKESYLAESVGSGTSTADQNLATAQSQTRGALRTAFGDMNDPEISESVKAGPAIAKAKSNIKNEFTRLTGTYQLPLNQGIQNNMDKAVADFRRGNPSSGTDGDTLQSYIDELNKGLPKSGILDGNSYQNERSKLSGLAANSSGDMKAAYSKMRDAMDDGMRNAIQVRVNAGQADPSEVNAFDKVRDQYRRYSIMQRATEGTEAGVTQGVNPNKLAKATEDVIGTDWANHPIGKYAISAIKHGQPLPQTENSFLKEVGPLGATLASGEMATHLMSGQLPGTIGSLAYLAPAAAALALRGAKIPWSRAVHSDLARPYLLNNVMPKGSPSQSVVRAAPNLGGDMAAALMKKRQESQ